MCPFPSQDQNMWQFLSGPRFSRMCLFCLDLQTSLVTSPSVSFLKVSIWTDKSRLPGIWKHVHILRNVSGLNKFTHIYWKLLKYENWRWAQIYSASRKAFFGTLGNRHLLCTHALTCNVNVVISLIIPGKYYLKLTLKKKCKVFPKCSREEPKLMATVCKDYACTLQYVHDMTKITLRSITRQKIHCCW